MEILYILGGILAYFTTGFIIGFMSNAIYRNNTPTEKLGWFKRLVRRFMFPMVSSNWKNRQEDIAENGPSIMDLSSNNHLNTEEYVSTYCFMMGILWPLKIALGLIYVVVSYATDALHELLKRITGLLNLITSPKNMVGRNKYDSLNKIFSEKKSLLESYLQKIESDMSSLKQLIIKWESLVAETRNSNHSTNFLTRYKAVLNRLQEEKRAIEKTKVDLARALDQIYQKESELTLSVKAFELYKETKEIVPILGDSADDMQRQIETSLAFVEEVMQRANSSLYGSETESLVQMEVPIEIIAKQVSEGLERNEISRAYVGGLVSQ